MEYTIIEGSDKETVTRVVNEHLKERWELSGNLVVIATEATHHQFIYHYFQAMIKAEENKFFSSSE